MLDLVLGPAGKYACCFKDVRVCRSAEGAASDHHLVTTLMSLHCSGKKQKTAQARTRAQWTSGPVAESIRRNPTAYQRELSTALGIGDEKSYGEIVRAIGKAAKTIRSTMSKTQTKPWYEDSKETMEPLIAIRKRAWKMYLRNQNEELSCLLQTT